MQSDRDLLKQALEALEIANGMLEWRGIYYADIDQAIASLRERLARCDDCGKPLGDADHIHTCSPQRLAQPEQEFTTHEEGEDGWSDWVCPDPQSYLMKCCDCGLVHEAQFGVVRYKSEAEREDCEKVDDPNLQAVFRMRRSEEWTPDDTAYRPGGLAQPEQYEQAVTDALAGGTGVMLGGKRIDPASIYKKPEQPDELMLWKSWALQAERLIEKFMQPEQEPVQHTKKYVTEQRPVGEIVQAFADLTAVSIPVMPPVGTKLYTAPPRREWVGLTDQEIDPITQAQWGWNAHGLHDAYRAYVRAIEAKLREKNA